MSKLVTVRKCYSLVFLQCWNVATTFPRKRHSSYLQNTLHWNIPLCKKVKCTLIQALRLCTGHMAHRGSRENNTYWSWSACQDRPHTHPFLTTAPEGRERAPSHPGHSLPPGKTQYPLYRKLGGPQAQSGQVQKNSPPPGFDARTIKPVASRYTDYATQPTYHCVPAGKSIISQYSSIYTNHIYSHNLHPYIHIDFTNKIQCHTFSNEFLVKC
jgi:hypothetical protein